MVIVAVGDDTVGSTRLSGGIQLVPFSLPTTCENLEGCIDPLTITWEWEGGAASEGVEQGWSLTGVTTAPPGGRPVAFAFGEISSHKVVDGRPSPVGFC